MASRMDIVKTAESMIGIKSGDIDFMIDWYNARPQLPRGVKFKKGYAWCALFASYVLGINGHNDYQEMSCGYMIQKAKEKGRWVEDDEHNAHIGDLLMYDWQDNGKGDNTGWPDHVGIVTDKRDNLLYTVEGNYGRQVRRRTLKVNSKYIRGFICPIYNDTGSNDLAMLSIVQDVVRGKYGNYPLRKQLLEAAGYDYEEVQSYVNKFLKGEWL